MKRFSVRLRVTAEQQQADHLYVTAPSAILAIQSAMLLRRVSYVRSATACDAANAVEGESIAVVNFFYRPARSQKVVR